ncbi:MAG TPA: beta-glucosidase [Acholeplasmataceae bacterium]|jgi:beta-glucosidase|nr:beta-glucosidase [Acholeplasmataceae bacterium]
MNSLSLIDKIKLLEGANVWQTKSLSVFPQLFMADGPHGLRKQVDHGDNLGIGGSLPATAFPTASLLACSWDKDLIAMVAKAIAKEAKTQKVHVVLGPGINIKRSPLCGRNFEYFSEDPYLTGILAASYVKAIECEGVGCAVKHFCCNNQETKRFIQNSVVDKRALNEIYLKAFKMAVRENPAMVMASYNKVNGYHSTESKEILDILRENWGYDGVIVTDWGASYNRINEVKNGCDLEMPSSNGYNTDSLLKEAEKDEKLKEAIDRSANRIIRLIHKYAKDEEVTFSKDEHHEIACIAASESMVLLKNKNILPLDRNDNVAIISGFIDNMRYQGGGSSHINPTKVDQICDLYKDYSDNIKLAKGFSLDDDGYDEKLFSEAIELSKNVDKVVLIVGLPERYETEGLDRESLDIPKGQVDLIKEIYKYNKNVIAVVVAGGVVNLNFAEYTKGLVMAYLGGQASSKAIMNILFGKANPSGRLAETFIDTIDECNVKLNDDDNVYYDESIYVGYRYYNTFNKKIRYPFGYGLSYTEFAYRDFNIVDDKVTVKVKNIGNYEGKEVVQLYLENNDSQVYKERRRLIKFAKVNLKPNEEEEVTFTLSLDDFTYFDYKLNKYTYDKGTYFIQIGKNVEEIIYSLPYEIKSNPETITNHEPLSYSKNEYDTSDFYKLFDKTLPPKKEKVQRPFTINSTLNDIKTTLIGKLIVRMLIKKADNLNIEEEWLQEVVLKTLFDTPIKALSNMSGNEFPIKAAEGVIDICNKKFIKGIKKLKEGLRK